MTTTITIRKNSYNEFEVPTERDDAGKPAAIYYTDDKQETLTEWTACPWCGGEGSPLGTQGTLTHMRCRDCGSNFNIPAEILGGEV